MDDQTYSSACATVATAFVDAYRSYLESRLDLIAPGVDVSEGIRQGAEWLRAELGQWAQLDAAEQGRGPLQIFQTAFAFPTTALEAAGVEPPPRDPGAQAALPGDVYALAPASSRQISEAAWRAHVEWGVTKARRVVDAVPAQGPERSTAVAVVTMDQADRASIHLVATGRAVAVRHWRNPGAIAAGLEEELPRWAVVDAAHSAADQAVNLLVESGARVAVYVAGLDDIATARWLAKGATTVVDRDNLVPVLESWLPQLA